MNATAEWRTLLQLLRGQPRQGSHVERLHAFYAPQAQNYDSFRERLLQGRRELIERLDIQPGSSVVELGCGTGRNMEFFGERLCALERLTLVDVCQPLLQVARTRATQCPPVIDVIEADIETYKPEHPVDCVYFSYSLSMTANWKKTLYNAVRMLRPGGTLGVVDFFISDSRPPPGRTRHGWFSRQFWPRWFAHDGVRLSPAHLRELVACTDTLHLDERKASVPWIPGIRAPYYLYIGRKRRG
ncbi:MAG: class I SAM-dependent methyltransferase [Burkholderiales bacterium]